MDFLGVIQKARDSIFLQDPEKGLKSLRQAIGELENKLPLIGRIITQKKHYCGRIEELKLNNHVQLYFVIVDCDRHGKSLKSAKTYKVKVSLGELQNIQI